LKEWAIHGQADGLAVRQALREDEQERFGGCGCDLRSGAATEYAFRADQECWAATDPGFAPARQGFVKARTAQGNQIHSMLAEFGLIIPSSIGCTGVT